MRLRQRQGGDPEHELFSMFEVPESLQGDFVIDVDEETQRLFGIGDEAVGRIYEDFKEAKEKEKRGQSFILMIVLDEEGKAHLRAKPGFDFVATPETEHEDDFNKKIEDVAKRKIIEARAVKEFKCPVGFPTHAQWTGVVHDDFENDIKRKINEDKETFTLDPGSTRLFCAARIHNGVFYWINRSAKHASLFSPDPLAMACNMFLELPHYEGYQRDTKFDMFYHLTRSVPIKFLSKITEAAEVKINKSPHIKKPFQFDLKECTNKKYEQEWEAIRTKFRENRAEAEKDIQHRLMRNLHFFLSNLHVERDNDLALHILKQGLTASLRHGIYIDIDFIPPEFEGHERVLDKKFNDSSFRHFLLEYREQSLLGLLKRKNFTEAKKRLAKLDESSHGKYFSENMKELLRNILSEDKPNFDKVNSQGQTLLHLAIIDGTNKESLATIASLVNPNIYDKEGKTPLDHLVDKAKKTSDQRERSDIYDTIKHLLENGADLHCEDTQGNTPFTRAWQACDNPFFTNLLLEQPRKLPDSYANKNFYYSIMNNINRNIKLGYFDSFESLLKTIPLQENPQIKANLQAVVLNVIAMILQQGKHDARDIIKLYELDSKYHLLENVKEAKEAEDEKSLLHLEKRFMATLFKQLDKNLTEHDNDYAQHILLRGLKVSAKHGIFIDNDFTPLEFEGLERALKTKSADNLLPQFLLEYQEKSFMALLKRQNFTEAKKRIAKLDTSSDERYFLKESKELLLNILSEEKPNFACVNSQGQTLLHLAMIHNVNLESVETILALNINPNICDKEGKTPLDYALDLLEKASTQTEQIHIYEIINLLLKNGANLHFEDKQENTPFIRAWRLNDAPYFTELWLEQPIKFPDSYANKDFYNTLMDNIQSAVGSGHYDAFEYLLRALPLQENPQIKATLQNIVLITITAFLEHGEDNKSCIPKLLELDSKYHLLENVKEKEDADDEKSIPLLEKRFMATLVKQFEKTLTEKVDPKIILDQMIYEGMPTISISTQKRIELLTQFLTYVDSIPDPGTRIELIEGMLNQEKSIAASLFFQSSPTPTTSLGFFSPEDAELTAVKQKFIAMQKNPTNEPLSISQSRT
ncbi:MAG: ankyrin repeat domain-containing protein [Gammaproteobacteria bacterium]